MKVILLCRTFLGFVLCTRIKRNVNPTFCETDLDCHVGKGKYIELPGRCFESQFDYNCWDSEGGANPICYRRAKRAVGVPPEGLQNAVYCEKVIFQSQSINDITDYINVLRIAVKYDFVPSFLASATVPRSRFGDSMQMKKTITPCQVRSVRKQKSECTLVINWN